MYEFLNIDEILKTNAEATIISCNNGKFKKFNYLKYKSQPIKDQTLPTIQANLRNLMEMPLKVTPT